MKHFKTHPGGPLLGGVKVPGDKSISHRCVMFGAIAQGTTHLQGLLLGEDVLATVNAFRRCKVRIDLEQEQLKIYGNGVRGLTAPEKPIDCGNSGTSMRLLTGLFAGQPFATTLCGDASLSSRPMQRVVSPLRQMGAEIRLSDTNTAPISISPVTALKPISWELPVASAQVKSAVLLAGMYAKGNTTVIEPEVTRDHTETLFDAFGVAVSRKKNRISLAGGQKLTGRSIEIPADISSAAFFIVAALLHSKSDITLKTVGINPTRTGLLKVLAAMGAKFEILNSRQLGQEPVCDLKVSSVGSLQGVEVDPSLIPTMIDEIPILAVAAAAATGKTAITGCKELRHKESDRIHAICRGLESVGIAVEENADGMVITGGKMSGGTVDSFGDHRIAMSFAVAGSIASQPTVVQNVECVDTSFPGFGSSARSLGLKIEEIHGS